MAVDHINAQGGIKALGGAKLKLVVLDSGDTTEKAKNAAQRMVAQETDLVAASGAYLSSFTLAVTEVTERASLPVLTLSYSDLITDRGFKYVFQTSATAGSQARQALPQIIKLAESGLRQAAEDCRDPDRQHGGLDRLRKGDARGPAGGKRAAADRRRDVHAAAGGCDLAGAEDPLGETRSALLPADGDLGREAAAREDERVRPWPGQGADDLVRHRDRRAGHAANRQPRTAPGRADLRRKLGRQGPRGADRRVEDPLQGAVDDAERDLHLWRHVGDQGRAREGRQGRPRCRRRGAAHHGCRPLEILSAGRDQVRREGPPRRRRHDHRAVAVRRAGDGVPAPARAGAAVLARTEN